MDGLIVLEPYATLIIEGTKKLELRSKPPPHSKIGKKFYLLSSGDVLGIVRIASWSGPLNAADLRALSNQHQVRKPIRGQYGWKIEVVERFKTRRPYIHRRGARIWLKNIQLFG